MAPGHVRIASGGYIFMETEFKFLNAGGSIGWHGIVLLPVLFSITAQVRTPEVYLGDGFPVSTKPVIGHDRIVRKGKNIYAICHIRELQPLYWAFAGCKLKGHINGLICPRMLNHIPPPIVRILIPALYSKIVPPVHGAFPAPRIIASRYGRNV